MKFDMCGGAAVIEAIAALAELRAPVRVLGLIGATENLPSGDAVKPGDIVRALDGTTVEVNNTDAEGRLVLADCISYARREGARAARRRRDADRRDRGRARVDVRGADEQRRRVGRARRGRRRERTGELVWRMPLHRDYAEMIKGRYGEIVNSTTKREATALTAGEFLHHFAGDVPWAHLDIAGTAWDVRRPYFADKGATGYGVRLLVDLARGGAGTGDAALAGPAGPCGHSDHGRPCDSTCAVLTAVAGHACTRHGARSQRVRWRAQQLGSSYSRIRLTKLRSAPTRPWIRTRREANSPIAARPRASIGLGTPPTVGATISAARSGSAPLIRSPGAAAGPSSTSTPSLAEHDPHGRIGLLHLQLDLEPERAGLGGPALHPALDDRHDRGRQAALAERAEPHLGQSGARGTS